MRPLILPLPADVAIALRKFAAENEQTHEAAAILALREMLTTLGYLEPAIDLDEDTETMGEA